MNTLKLRELGYLPIQFGLAAIIVVIFLMLIPELRAAVLDPKKANMKKSYRTLYLMNVAFILGNALIFVLIP
jgi:hypothetical protein